MQARIAVLFHSTWLVVVLGLGSGSWPASQGSGDGERQVVFEGRAQLGDRESVRVGVGVRIEGVRHLLARVETREDGSFRVSAVLPEALDRIGEDAVFYAHIAEPGYQAYARRGQMGADGVVRVPTLHPAPGCTLVGRVTTADGQPVSLAQVAVLPFPAPTPLAWNSVVEQVRTERDGSFEILHDEAGPFSLQAWATGRGAAFVPRIELGGAESGQLHVVLAGAGTLAGRVIDVCGEPVPGLVLSALPAEMETVLDERRGILLTGFGGRDRPHDGDRAVGLFWDQTKTGADGEFRFDGLALGEYWFDVPGCGSSLSCPGPVRELHATGTQDAVVILRQHILEIRPTDEGGVRLDPAGVFCLWDDRSSDLRFAFPGHARGYAGFPSTEGDAIRLSPSRDRAARFLVSPAQRYRLGYFGSGHVAPGELFFVPPAEYASLTDLVAPERSTGTLKLDLRDGSGGVLPFKRIDIATSSAIVRSFLPQELQAPCAEIDLPSWSYELIVRYHLPSLPSCVDEPDPPPRDELDVARVHFAIPPAGVTELALPSSRGGRLEVVVELPATQRTRALLALLDADDALGADRGDAILWGGPGGFVLRDGSGPLPGKRDRELRFWDPQTRRMVTPRPGRPTLVWERLAPGPHLLEIEADGYRPTKGQVTIIEGEIVRFEVKLQES